MSDIVKAKLKDELLGTASYKSVAKKVVEAPKRNKD